MRFKLIVLSILAIIISLLYIFVAAGSLEHLKTKLKEHFPIQKVVVIGNLQFTDSKHIENSVASLLEEGFFLIDIKTVKQNILKLPWVKQAIIGRRWPNKINIAISEYSPIALWNNSAVVVETGKLIYPNRLPNAEALPKFFSHNQDVSSLLEVYFAIMPTIEPIGLKVENLRYMQDNSLQVALNDGIELKLGQDNLVPKLNRFIRAYKKVLKEVAAKIAYVDLRYINGLAVGWRS